MRVPRPPDEARRVLAVRTLGLLDTEPEERFDRITRTLAQLLDAPMAMFTLIDADRQWAKSCVGLPGGVAPRDEAFCARTILGPDALVVPDLIEDPDFAWTQGVLETGLRFYAGHPVRSPTGERVGAICVMDYRPRTLEPRQIDQLRDLAGWAEAELGRTDAAEVVRSLRRSEARLWAIVDTVGDGILTFTSAGRVRFANHAAEAMFGAEPGGLTGATSASLVTGEDGLVWDPERGVPAVTGTAKGVGVYGDWRLIGGRRRDGASFPLEVIVSEADVDGERVVVAAARDVTERQRSEAAQREADWRFRAMFDNAGLGIVFMDVLAGRAIAVNQAFADMMGYTVEELRGEGFWVVSHPEGRADDQELLRALNAGEVGHLQREQRFVRRDGSVFWGRLNLTVIPNGEPVPAYGIGVFEDISERREAERVKDEFVSIVGHELRTPLTSIRGSLGLMEAGVLGSLPEEAARMLTLAVSNTDRLVRLINDILDIERMDAGQMEIRLTSLEASSLVEQAVQVVQSAADAAAVALRVEADEGSVVADGDRIVQALVNLLGNAVKFSPPGAEVVVAVGAIGDEVRFSVRDHGRGIPADQLEVIFDRFHQVDGSDAREKGGTGLGLPIARAIVEHHDHGGRLWAENAPDGRGAILSFTLPAVRDLALLVRSGRSDELLAEISDVVPALRPRTILVVEDDLALGEVLTRTLGHDAPVLLVRTAEEAIRAIRAEPPAVIVLDLVLPGDDGFSIVDRLRGDGLLADVPIVVYTALDLGAGERERLQLGRVEFLAKRSATPADVERRVAELLAVS